jgi:hypothetical protein
MKKFLLLTALTLCTFTLFAEDFKYPCAPGERDPFTALVNDRGDVVIHEETGINDLALQGIMYSPDSSTVVINNDIYRVGDFIGKHKIKKIEQNGVLIESGGQEYFIKWEG